MAYSNDLNFASIGVENFSTTEIKLASDYLCSHVISHYMDVIDPSAHVQFDCRRWNVGDFQVCDFSYGECEVDIKVEEPKENGFFIIVPLNGQANVIANGRESLLRPGSAMAFTTKEAAGISLHDSKYFRNFNISMPYGALESFLASEFDLPITRDILFAKGPMKITEEFTFLIDYIKWFSSQLEGGELAPGLLSSPHLANNMHNLLMSLLVSTVENNYQELYSSYEKSNGTPVYVSLAEEFIRENSSQMITVQEVAQEVGVAVRTLHMGFQRHRNYSVSVFLRNERLLVARKELATAKERNLSVTDVAYSCGFSHLSKFAVAYHKRFGENPSDTLRRGI